MVVVGTLFPLCMLVVCLLSKLRNLGSVLKSPRSLDVVFSKGKDNSSLTHRIDMKTELRWATDGPEFSESYIVLRKKKF